MTKWTSDDVDVIKNIQVFAIQLELVSRIPKVPCSRKEAERIYEYRKLVDSKKLQEF